MANADQLIELFHEAKTRPAGAERERFLAEHCRDDAALKEQIVSLLEADADEGESGFLKHTQVLPPVTMLTEKPGDKIGHYKLLQKIGEGGCGVVYMAEQEEPVRRRVAFKVIKLGMDTKQVVARFEAERQALAMMDHANIAKVFDAGATDTGRPYFVMELVRGTKITDYCNQKNLSTPERLDLFIQVCHAIQHAHQKGIIHRDIKPSNILVTQDERTAVPKVIDFGIAKATIGHLTDKTVFTAFEQFIGTPAYMSPEQAEMTSLDIDTRTDIYSLGVLLYELLAGQTPFDAQELMAAGLDAMRRIIREKEPVRPSTRLSTMLAADLTTTARHRHTDAPKLIHLVRGDLDWVVMKALEKDRTRRYETANALAMDIQRHLNNEPVTACPPSRWYEFRKSVRRHKFGFAAASAVTAALALGLGLSTWMFFQEREAYQRAATAERKARTEAARSRQVAQFLKDMLGGINPFVASGRDTTLLRQIADRTAQRLTKELKDQPDVEAELRNVLGEVYRLTGDFAKGEAMHRQALALRRNFSAHENADVAESLENLASNLRMGGKPAEAEPMQREAIEMRKRLLGAEHAVVAWSIRNLAQILGSQGKLAEAEALHREALAMRRKLLGEQHTDVADSLESMSWVLAKEGKLAEAETSAREALTIYRKETGAESGNVALSLSALAFVLEKQNRLAEAESTAREALAMDRKIFGSDHPWYLQTLDILSQVLQGEGKLAEAEATQREALTLRRKILAKDHPSVANSLVSLALVLCAQGKPVEAETFAQECLDFREQRTPDDWKTFNTRSVLGGSLLGQKRYAEAEPLLLSGYDGMKQRAASIPTDGKVRLKEALQRLVQLYEATGQSESAAKWNKKLAEFDQTEAEKKTAGPKP